jgi:hypothetical protein
MDPNSKRVVNLLIAWIEMIQRNLPIDFGTSEWLEMSAFELKNEIRTIMSDEVSNDNPSES